MKKAAWIAVGLFASASAFAAQQFGVEVYPNAKPEAAVSKQLKEKLNLKNSAAFRTSDSVSKVTDYYRKQKLQENPGTSDKGSSFMAPGKVMVTVQNPWMDMDSGKVMNDTLISFVKN